jgi:hypothetical protein
VLTGTSQTRDLLLPYGDVVMAFSIVLRIKRTLNGIEINDWISDMQTRKAQAAERRRRADWQRREFCSHFSGGNKITRVTQRCHVLHIIDRRDCESYYRWIGGCTRSQRSESPRR